MKKFFKSAAILACGFGLMMTATSCHKEADTVVTETVDVDAASPKVLIVAVNQSGATVKYGTKTLTAGAGNVYTLEGAAATGKLTVSLDDYFTQDIDVDFGSSNVVTLDVTLVKKPTPTPGGGDVTNPTDNQGDNDGVQAVLSTGSASTVVPGADAAGYSIVVFTPATGNLDAPQAGNEYKNVSPYALNCTPDGVDFNAPGIPVSVTIPGSEGLEFSVKAGNEDANNVKLTGNVLSADLPHFSVWNIILNAKVLAVDDTQKKVLKSGALTAGKNNISYNKYVGFSTALEKKGILYKFLKALLGVSERQMAAKTVIDSPVAGSYVINQQVIVYTFQCGSTSFQATTYGKVSADVTYDSADSGSEEPTIVHSGGSNE